MASFVYYYNQGNVYKRSLEQAKALIGKKGDFDYAYITLTNVFLTFDGIHHSYVNRERVPPEFKAYLMLEGFPI